MPPRVSVILIQASGLADCEHFPDCKRNHKGVSQYESSPNPLGVGQLPQRRSREKGRKNKRGVGGGGVWGLELKRKRVGAARVRQQWWYVLVFAAVGWLGERLTAEWSGEMKFDDDLPRSAITAGPWLHCFRKREPRPSIAW